MSTGGAAPGEVWLDSVGAVFCVCCLSDETALWIMTAGVCDFYFSCTSALTSACDRRIA